MDQGASSTLVPIDEATNQLEPGVGNCIPKSRSNSFSFANQMTPPLTGNRGDSRHLANHAPDGGWLLYLGF